MSPTPMLKLAFVGHNFDHVLYRFNLRPTSRIDFFRLLFQREPLEFLDIEIDTVLIKCRGNLFELSHHRHDVLSLHIHLLVEGMEGL